MRRLIILRDYQRECVEILDSVESGSHMVVLATGLGKSVIFSSIKRRGRTLILSHRDELVRQPARYYDCSFGIEKGEEHSYGEEVVSASVQTLYRPGRLAAFRPDAFDTVIVDEAHHMARGNVTYRNILAYFRPRRIFGFTATPRRGDGARLDDVFEDVVFSRDIRWGIEHGWLVPIRAVRIMTGADISLVRNIAGDLNEGDLEKVLEKSDAVAQTARAYITRCHFRERQTLLYTVTVHMCELVLKAVRALLPAGERNTVQVITGKTPAEERKATLDAFREGQVRCIINCMVLTEGFDAPVADAIVVMRPTRSETLYQQIVGRGLRLCEGKKDCLVIDIAGRNEDRRRICSAPSLFGIDMRYATSAQRKEMEEEYDLIDKVNAIRGSLGERERGVGSLGHMEDAIERFAAEQLENILEEKDGEKPPELASFHVHAGPSEERRYGIDFRSGMLYLSEPDVLNRTCVRVEKEGKVYLDEMSLEEAAAFAAKLVRVFRAPAYLWDAECRKKWKMEPATPAQVTKIARIQSFGQPVPAGLSKAQACEVIELDNRVRALRRELEERGSFPVPGMTEGDVHKKVFETACNKYFREKADAERAGREQFALFERYVEKRYRKILHGKKTTVKKDTGEVERPFAFLSPKEAIYHVDITLIRRCSDKRRATHRQTALISELEEGLRQKGILIEGGISVPDMERANRLIAFLLQAGKDLSEFPGDDQVWRIQANDLDALIAKAKGGRMQGKVFLRRMEDT